MTESIKYFINQEVELANKALELNDLDTAFRHLERTHILGQSITYEHARVHILMLKIGWKRKDWHEIFGQIFRIIGALTKTLIGIYPKGNTGGANVSPFKPMLISEDLQLILNRAKT
jgi:Protein of unknown function (DUF3703)